eukprot:PITA_20643
MLQTYVMQQPLKWEDYLHLVELVYNNDYHTSLQMSPFEVLYRHKCRTPLSWGSPEEKFMQGPDMLKEMEDMVKKVCSNLKVAQDQQKYFVDRESSFQEFQVGDHVYVETEGEFLVEPLGILDRREVMLWKQVMTQVKVIWKHYGPKEAT